MKRTDIRLPDWLHEALTKKGQQEGKSLNQTMGGILEAAILTARADEYLADIWLGEITRYCLIRSAGRYAFVWGVDTFPADEGLVPAVNVELQEEGIMWFSTQDGAKGAAAEAFAALEQQGEYVGDLREAFGLQERIKDLQTSAAALYDGGWRAEDREELIAEHDLTEEDADKICELLEEFEEEQN